MEKLDYLIGETFTEPTGKMIEVIASPGTDCNQCKGCFFGNVIKASDEESADTCACNAPENLNCCHPDRIFVELKTVQS